MFDKEIAVIGGGVTGITTALTLQLLGFPTTCYTRDMVPGCSGEKEDAGDGSPGGGKTRDDPRFASLYPAASVIPHSIEAGGRLKSLFTATQKIFAHLARRGFPGVERHRHYEVFEFPRDMPAYVSLLDRPGAIDPDDPFLPRRDRTGKLHGWVFDCWFTEWPRYMPALCRAYRQAGGRLLRREVDRGELSGLSEDILVNATGVWSPGLFGRPAHASGEEGRPVEQGHLVSLPGAPLHRNDAGDILSYNYTPRPEVYADPSGEACDVYFYPRSDGWVIGGSRIEGMLTEDGTFEGPDPGQTVEVDGLEVPRPILELNGKILEGWGLTLAGRSPRSARMGYRYLGHPASGGLELASRRQMGHKVIHNYGHGGAGVTLSWGCALACAILVRREAGSGWERGLNEVCLQLADALQHIQGPAGETARGG